MTFGMRLRMWAKEAPRSHVVSTAAVVLALLVGLAAISVPAGRRLADTTAAPELRTVGAAGEAAQGAGGTSAEAAATDATGAGGATVAGATTRASGGGAAGKAGTTGSVTTGAGGTGATNVTLKASDVGVTKDTIKVGFLNAQIGGFDATGFALGFRDDLEAVEKALVDKANKDGGVQGRKITYVTGKADPLSQTSMRAGCITMTDDQKVFAVFDQTALTGTALNCYPEKRTPAFTSNAGTVDSKFWTKAGGYLISGGSTFDRGIQNWATMMLEDGFIGAGKGKLGILSDDCAPDPDVVDNILKPFLTREGHRLRRPRVSCDAGHRAQKQVGAAALNSGARGRPRAAAPLFTTPQSLRAGGRRPVVEAEVHGDGQEQPGARRDDAGVLAHCVRRRARHDIRAQRRGPRRCAVRAGCKALLRHHRRGRPASDHQPDGQGRPGRRRL